jgi:hypothetical protein
MKKIILILTVVFVNLASAVVFITPGPTVFRDGSGTRLSFETKYVKFDKLNLNGTIYGLRLGWQPTIKQNFDVKFGFFIDNGNIGDKTIIESGAYLAPAFTYYINNNFSYSIYAGIQAKETFIDNDDSAGFPIFGGIEFRYNHLGIGFEYSKASMTFETGDVDETTFSGNIIYKF